MINEREIASKVFQFFRDVLAEKGYGAFSLSAKGIHFYDKCNSPVEGYHNLHEVANHYNGVLDQHLGFYSFFKRAIVEGLQEVLDLFFQRNPEAIIWVRDDGVIMVSKKGDWSDNEIYENFYDIFAPLVKEMSG